MHLVYISKPRFESFDKPHVAVLQSAGFENAFRALLSGYARMKRPKHSPEKMYALYTAMLMAVGMLLPCFFPTFLVSSGWVGSFLVSSPNAFSNRIDCVWPTVSLRGGAQHCQSPSWSRLLHRSPIYPIMPSENIWKLHVNIHQDLPISHSFFNPCWHPEQQFPQTLSSVGKTAQRDVLLPWSGLPASKMESFQKCDQS